MQAITYAYDKKVLWGNWNCTWHYLNAELSWWYRIISCKITPLQPFIKCQFKYFLFLFFFGGRGRRFVCINLVIILTYLLHWTPWPTDIICPCINTVNINMSVSDIYHINILWCIAMITMNSSTMYTVLSTEQYQVPVNRLSPTEWSTSSSIIMWLNTNKYLTIVFFYH